MNGVVIEEDACASCYPAAADLQIASENCRPCRRARPGRCGRPKKGEPGHKGGSLSIDALIKGVPGVEKQARGDGEQIASIGSQDMNDAVWAAPAKRADELLATSDVDGIMVTHGTDMIEETAFFMGSC